MDEEPALPLDPAGEAVKAAVAGKDPVTRDDDDGRVQRRGHPDRAERLRLADRRCHVAVGARRPGTNRRSSAQTRSWNGVPARST